MSVGKLRYEVTTRVEAVAFSVSLLKTLPICLVSKSCGGGSKIFGEKKQKFTCSKGALFAV